MLATAQLGSTILTEASLSFLGLGVPEPNPSWGRMLSESAAEYVRTAPWLVIFPGTAISLVVFASNLLGDALRDTISLVDKMAGKKGISCFLVPTATPGARPPGASQPLVRVRADGYDAGHLDWEYLTDRKIRSGKRRCPAYSYIVITTGLHSGSVGAFCSTSTSLVRSAVASPNMSFWPASSAQRWNRTVGSSPRGSRKTRNSPRAWLNLTH